MTLTYEEIGIPPIVGFDYKSYNKVTLSLFRIGADTVEADIPATSRKDLGAQRLSARSTTSVGNRTKRLTFPTTLTSLILQSIPPVTNS